VTERLYYTDAYLREFDADVVSVHEIEGRHAVVLDRTAFYPASGGQPFDLGTIETARVVDVVDREDGAVAHVIEGEPPAGRVRGRIEWDRRFDHMQQHTGQHVLSAAFERVTGVRTLSFHLGAASATIDLEREVTPDEIARAEWAANDVVWDNRPVSIRFVDAEDAVSLPLRKEPARTGRLRLIDIEHFDLSACGGTHVERTGAIGLIAVSSWERFRGGTRLEFRCGMRALREHRSLRETVTAGLRLLSAAPGELPAAIERLQGENRDLRRRTKDLDARLAAFEADALAESAEEIGGRRVVIAALEGLDMTGLKTVAQHITARPKYVAAIFTPASPYTIVIAAARDAAFDSSALLKKLVAEFGGKGGGRGELAQGGGLEGGLDQIVAAVRAFMG
jgi:alanyl-tRNA synthetase